MEIKSQLQQIADRIKYLRDILDMSAMDLAKAIDMPLELYNSYENCEKDIPISIKQHTMIKTEAIDIIPFE